MIAFRGIGDVYYLLDKQRVQEVSGRVVPVVTLALDDNRIVLAPFDFKIVKCFLDSILVDHLICSFRFRMNSFRFLQATYLTESSERYRNWTVVCGKTLAIVSGKSLSLSTQAMRMS